MVEPPLAAVVDPLEAAGDADEIVIIRLNNNQYDYRTRSEKLKRLSKKIGTGPAARDFVQHIWVQRHAGCRRPSSHF